MQPQEYTDYGNDAQPMDGQPSAMSNIRAINQANDDRESKHLRLLGTLGSDYTLDADEIKSGVIELNWTLTANVTVKIPITGSADGTRRRLPIYNHTTGSFTVTVKTTETGSTGVTIAQGYMREVWHNDLHVYPAGNEIPLSTASTLPAGIVAHWKLDETSAGTAAVTRNDSVGSNHLTDNGTVPSTTGKINNGALFVTANSEYLSVADNANLSTGDIDFSIAVWVKLTAKTTAQDIVAKWGASGQFEYIITYDNGADRFGFTVSNNGTATAAVVANTFGSPSAGTWYLIIAYHDASGNVIGITVNAGTADTTAHTTGVFNSTAEFRIGARTSSPLYLNAAVDEVSFWKKVLSSAERTELYAAGAGKPWPF